MGRDSTYALSVVALSLLVGACANQKDVTPLLRVEPNAAARFSYFEKRAAAMIREQRGPQAEEEAEDVCIAEEPPALRTWGGPDPEGPAALADEPDAQDDAEAQGTSCDRAQND